MADESQTSPAAPAAAAPAPTPDMEGRAATLLRLADGRSLKMRCDQRAAFRIQRATGRSVYAHVDAITAQASYIKGSDGKDLLDTMSADMSEVVEVAFYLSATDLRDRGLDEMTLDEFLDLLPPPGVAAQSKLLADVLGVVYGTVGGGASSGNAAAPAQEPANEAATQDGSTGSDAATSAG